MFYCTVCFPYTWPFTLLDPRRNRDDLDPCSHESFLYILTSSVLFLFKVIFSLVYPFSWREEICTTYSDWPRLMSLSWCSLPFLNRSSISARCSALLVLLSFLCRRDSFFHHNCHLSKTLQLSATGLTIYFFSTATIYIYLSLYISLHTSI